MKTALENSLPSFLGEVRELDVSGYDLVVNDFEPVSAWAAKRQKVPTVSISHQNAFLFDVPQKGANWLDDSVIQHFAPSQYQLGLHWYHFGQPILLPSFTPLSRMLPRKILFWSTCHLKTPMPSLTFFFALLGITLFVITLIISNTRKLRIS